jgi:hypothetical protein
MEAAEKAANEKAAADKAAADKALLTRPLPAATSATAAGVDRTRPRRGAAPGADDKARAQAAGGKKGGKKKK